MSRFPLYKLAILLIAGGFTANAVAEDIRLPDMGSPADAILSKSEENRFGRAIMAQIRRSGEVVEDPLVNEYINEIGHNKMGLLIITHHDKLLEHNPPNFTHVILGGRIVETGGKELADELHSRGYERIREQYPEAAAANDNVTVETAAT